MPYRSDQHCTYKRVLSPQENLSTPLINDLCGFLAFCKAIDVLFSIDSAADYGATFQGGSRRVEAAAASNPAARLRGLQRPPLTVKHRRRREALIR